METYSYDQVLDFVRNNDNGDYISISYDHDKNAVEIVYFEKTDNSVDVLLEAGVLFDEYNYFLDSYNIEDPTPEDILIKLKGLNFIKIEKGKIATDVSSYYPERVLFNLFDFEEPVFKEDDEEGEIRFSNSVNKFFAENGLQTELIFDLV